jgi:hypothetical protein
MPERCRILVPVSKGNRGNENKKKIFLKFQKKYCDNNRLFSLADYHRNVNYGRNGLIESFSDRPISARWPEHGLQVAAGPLHGQRGQGRAQGGLDSRGSSNQSDQL